MLKYQEKVLKELYGGKRAVFIRYGSGKTRTLLKFIESCRETNGGEPADAMVICPNHLRDTWSKQVAEWGNDTTMFHQLNRTVLTPETPESDCWVGGVGPEADMPIFDHIWLVPVSKFSSGRFIPWPKYISMVIVDESTLMKNPEARCTKKLLYLADTLFKDVPRIVLSGNPTPENPTEIWSQFRFAYGNATPFEVTYYKFLMKWFIKTQFGYSLRHDLHNEFWSIVKRYSITLSAEDHVEFEAMAPTNSTYKMLITESSPEQQRMLDELYETWSLNGVDFDHKMTLQQKACQLASGFFYDAHGTSPLVTQPKAELMKMVIQEAINAGHTRIAVWHRYVGEIPIIMQHIPERANTVLISSGNAVRMSELDKFDRPSADVMVAIMPISMAKGINELRHCSLAIIFSNEWSQEKRDQLESRHIRVGSKHKGATFIDLCVSGCIDRDISDALRNKSLTPAKLRTIVERVPSLKTLTECEQAAEVV